MNVALWSWVLKKAWKIEMKFFQKKEVENDARLNREIRSGIEWEN